MESQAVVFTAKNLVSYERILSPEPGPEDVVVDLHYSWISNGTEGSFLRGERISGDVAWRFGDQAPFPMVAGYQKVGRVRSVGADVTRYKPGDWVFASMSRVTGMFDNQHAGHVSPSVCAQEGLLPLPGGVDPVAFSGLVLTQVGYNCGTRSPILPGQVAVVAGDGLVGQWSGQTLARQGAHVVMLGRHPDRLARFAGLGRTILSGSDNGITAFQALGMGPVQVLVETTGRAELLLDYLPLMARGGHMVIAGFYPAAGALDFQLLLQRFRNAEISFDLPSGATGPRLAETLRWVADGRLDTLGLITHRFPVERAAEAWALIESKREPVLGVVLEWPAARPS
jgi:2-desacetyl-2-hydroxyethyl bacteriochlorophyllide A dehydrogenase